MNYTGNICPGCQQAFKDDDDIVVCPECGTPQHRECYEKDNCCVNSHLHSDDYKWQGIEAPKHKTATPKAEAIPCPNCGIDNPKGSQVCRNCGMKFTLFGMNVVDAIDAENRRNQNPNKDIPDYKAPFTLGEGEGFDLQPSQEINTTAEQVENLLTDILTGQTEEAQPEDGRLNLGGPFPLTDEIDGVRINTIGNFIGSNALSYISKFRKMQAGKKISFNFASFFFAPYWFFYRKLYKPGIVFMTAFLTLAILAMPSYMKVMEILNQIASLASIENLTDAQLNQLNTLMDSMNAAMPSMIVFSIIIIAVRIVCGFLANHIYKKHVIENAGKAERLPDKKSAMAHIVKNGGASILIAMASFFANELISTLVSYILQ